MKYRLFDTQWMNVVNNPEVMGAYDVEHAVAIAVKLTEEAMAKNIEANNWPKTKPCHSPYCECEAGKCTHPGFYDARHEGTTP
jgi:hypothetical protein